MIRKTTTYEHWFDEPYSLRKGDAFNLSINGVLSSDLELKFDDIPEGVDKVYGIRRIMKYNYHYRLVCDDYTLIYEPKT